MKNKLQSHLRFPRPRSGPRPTRGQTCPIVSNNMVELETLSAFSALERRAVTLSEDEIEVCSRLAELLLDDALNAYSLASHQIDLQQWKLIKKKDSLIVYRQRKKAADVLTTSQCTTNETDMPLLLVTGYLAGHVNDAMYGLVSANTRDMKMNSAYAQDSLEDAQVLTTIDGPTVEEPFRFLGLKWVVRRDVISGSFLVKRRDLLYLEATGVTNMDNGEQIGYRVMHSLSIKALASLAMTSISSPVIRARASIVQLFHQQPSPEEFSGTLNVFTRGYYDPQGDLMQFMAVNAGAELLLNMTFSAVDCAHLKKIAFAVQQAERRRKASSQLNSANNGGRRMEGIEEIGDEDGDLVRKRSFSTNCFHCDRRLNRFLSRSDMACTICAKIVCSRCSVIKKLQFTSGVDNSILMDSTEDPCGSRSVQPIDQPETSRATTERSRSKSGNATASTNDICQKTLKFCVPCVLRANQRNAAQIVAEKIMEQTSLNRGGSDSRASSIWWRSTHTGQSCNLALVPYYAVSADYLPRQQTPSSATQRQTGVYRSSSGTSRVMLYIKDPLPNLPGSSAA